MKKKPNLQAQKAGVLTFCLVFLLSTFLPQVDLYRLPTEDSNNDPLAKVEESYGKVPLVFESNIGQTDEQVKFLNRTGNTTTYFTPTETVMVRSQNLGDKDNPELVSDVLRMSLNGANDNPEITGLEEQQAKSNYFIGDNSDSWKSDITNYGKIKYSEVYPGIDLHYYGSNSQMEHDFVVAPGSDPSRISFNLDGANDIYIDTDGNLVLTQVNGTTVFQKPLSYQESKNNEVETSYVINGDKTIKFAFADYDASKQLIIDPVVLEYSTYLGGSGFDGAYGAVVDQDSNAYIVGQTDSTDFPTSSPYQASNAGGTDVFVSKFGPNGSLVYSTYVGGTGSLDQGFSIDIDFDLNVYISGRTNSTDFPTLSAFQSSNAGGTSDAFVTKINSSGSGLIYSTYLGGTGDDREGIVVADNLGYAYIAGSTDSTDFPTASPYQASNGGIIDFYVTKLNQAGDSLEFSTYLGGSNVDYEASGIGLDSNNNVYFTGTTRSTNYPTASPYQASHGGGTNDAVLTKFNSDGSSLVYSTYLGGSSLDQGTNLTIDENDNIYLTGHTNSTDFPVSSPYQASNGGSYDAFVSKFDSTGSLLLFSTYLGGSGNEFGRDIAVSQYGLGVVGETDSSDFPTTNAYNDNYSGGTDAFVSNFNLAGSSINYSTYLGGTDYDTSIAVGMDLAGNIYTAGLTYSTDFPTVSAYQGSSVGGAEIFLTKLNSHSVVVTGQVNPTLTFTVDDTTCDLGVISASSTGSCTHTMTAGTNASNGYAISYLPTNTLTSGASDTITETGTTGATSSQGSEQFGLNLKDNATPNIGAEPSGGVGVASTNYATADTFSFDTFGAQVAASSTLSDTTTFTVSYIANVANTTEAGNYSTTQTYNIVASY